MISKPIVVLDEDVSKYTEFTGDELVEYVYFVLSPTLEAVKIGRTTGIRGRFYALQTASADKLQLLGLFPWFHEAERYFHNRFQAYRMHGEWFSVEGRLKLFIDGEFTVEKAIEKPFSPPKRHPLCHLTIEQEKAVVDQFKTDEHERPAVCVSKCAEKYDVSISTIQGILEKYGALDGRTKHQKLRASFYAQQMREKYHGDKREWDLSHIEDEGAWLEELEEVGQWRENG